MACAGGAEEGGREAQAGHAGGRAGSDAGAAGAGGEMMVGGRGEAGQGAGGASGAAAPPEGANPYHAGLYEDDGSPHAEFQPNPVTGRTIKVAANPSDDGMDDRPAIQTALDEAQFGDEVYLPNGVYNILSATDEEGALMLKSGVNLRGESEASVILKVDGAGNAEGIVSAYAKTDDVEDVVISNLSIIHAAGTFKYGIRVAKNTSFGEGVVRRIKVDHVTVKNAERRAFRVYCASDIIVSNCTASDMVSEEDGYGFEAMCEGGNKVDSKFIVFRNDRALGPRMRHGFIIQDHVHHSLIEGCITTKNFFGAIELHANGEHHIEIRKNTVEESFGAGIKIRSGAGSENWVHGNTIRGAQWGILVETPNNTIEGNVLVDFIRNDEDLFGIYASASDGVVIRNNVIKGNHVNHTSYSFCGLYLAHGEADVRGNVITGNHVGVCGSGAAAVDVGKNEVVDNVVANVKN